MKSQEDEFYQEASTSVADYVENSTPVRKEKRKRRKKSIIFLVLALLIIGGAAAYFLTKPKKAAENTQAQAPAQETVEAPVSTENFVSQDLKLTFDYPSNWTVDDNTTGQIRVVSPKVSIKNADGQAADGSVVVLIRSKSLPLSEFSANAQAVQASEKFSYTSPTSNQRQETFLSFLSFGASSSAVDSVFITGDSGYQQGATVSKADLTPVEPIVSIAFYACDKAECEESTAFMFEEWGSNKIFTTAKEILRSLSIN